MTIRQHDTYQMKMTKMFMVDSARQLQKSTSGLPLAFIRLSMTPISTENTTSPRMFVAPVVVSPGSNLIAVTSVHKQKQNNI